MHGMAHTRAPKLDSGVTDKNGVPISADTEEHDAPEENGRRARYRMDDELYGDFQPDRVVAPGPTEDDDDNHDREQCY